MKKKWIVLQIVLIVFLLILFVVFINKEKINQIKNNESSVKKELQIDELEILVETYHAKDNEIRLLVTATCNDGVKSLKEVNDNNIIYGNENKKIVSMDLNTENNGTYTFEAISCKDEKIQKNIKINSEYINSIIQVKATPNSESEALFNLEIIYPETILNRNLKNYYRFSEDQEWIEYTEKQKISVFTIDKYVDNKANLTVYTKQEDDMKNEVINEKKVPIDTIIQTDMYIYTVANLQKLQEYVNLGATYEGKTIYLMRDLDLSGVCSQTKGSWTPIGKFVSDNEWYSFNGTFEGNNHTISNLYIDGITQYQGLFGVAMNGKIQNLNISGNVNSTKENIGLLVGGSTSDISNVKTLTGSVVRSKNNNTGGVVGWVQASIEKCGNNAVVIADSGSTSTSIYSTGGIAGYAASGSIIRNCYNKVNVTTNRYNAGGIVGSSYEVIVVGCYNTANIKAGAYRVAGIIGEAYMSNISYCYNAGIIENENISTGSNWNQGWCAGIVGYASNATKTTYCYNTGTIIGKGTCVGGVIGENDSWKDGAYSTETAAILSYSYNTGNVSSNAVGLGGIVGRNYRHALMNNSYCLSTITISGTSQYGLIYGITTNTSNVVNCSTLTPFKMPTVYSIVGKSGYFTTTNASVSKPVLKWE